MANHVTQAERDEIRAWAAGQVRLDQDGAVIDRAGTVAAVREHFGISQPRALGAVAKVARQQRAVLAGATPASRPTVVKQSVSLMPEVVGQVEAREDATRGSFSGVLAECLSRYFECLRRERAALRPQFAASELALLCDVCNGTLFSAPSIPLLYAEVEDSLPDGTAEKWAVDGPALVAKLRGLSYGQAAALVDAIERWWAAPDERPAFEEVLK